MLLAALNLFHVEKQEINAIINQSAFVPAVNIMCLCIFPQSLLLGFSHIVDLFNLNPSRLLFSFIHQSERVKTKDILNMGRLFCTWAGLRWPSLRNCIFACCNKCDRQISRSLPAEKLYFLCKCRYILFWWHHIVRNINGPLYYFCRCFIPSDI